MIKTAKNKIFFRVNGFRVRRTPTGFRTFTHDRKPTTLDQHLNIARYMEFEGLI